MARPSKIDPILRDLDPSCCYTVAEIVSRARLDGSLTLVYPDLETRLAVARAKKAVFSYIHRHNLEPTGKKDGQLAYRGSGFPCKAKIEDELLTEVARHGLALVPRSRQQRRWWAPAAVLLVCVSFLLLSSWIYRSEPGIPASLRGDVDGLRAFNRKHADERPVIADADQARMLAEIQRDLGLEARMDVRQVATYPFREEVAAAVAAAQDNVIGFTVDDLVAVFAHMDEPFWVVDDGAAYRAVCLGDWVRVNDLTGYVTLVGQHHLEVRTELGTTGLVQRRELVLFGRPEKHGYMSPVYPRPEGNLRPLLVLTAQRMGLVLEDRSELPGQAAGFLPPFQTPEELLEWLAPSGVVRRQEKLILNRSPTLKLQVGFHEHAFSLTAAETAVLSFFSDIAPVPVDIELSNDDQVWYTGQDLVTTLSNRGILVREDTGRFSLIR
ncbi:MAG: hypothetical protein QNK37_19365 [Acidobacteriota bacterium]|nr:hypothetical protein [Acidobacteriota bacterium]